MKRSLAVVALMALLCGLCGCRESDAGTASSREALRDFPVTVLEVTVKACPQRVLSLSPAVTDVLAELGSDAQLVGISDACRLNRELPRAGTTVSPDLAAVAALAPDLIFTTTALSAVSRAALEETGATVLAIPGADRYSQLPTFYTRVAQAVSGAITGTRNADNTFRRLEESLRALPQPAKPVKLAAYYASGLLIPAGGLTDDWMALAGGVNVSPGEQADDSAVAASGAEVILCDAGQEAALQQRFPSLRVLPFDVAAFTCGGERTAAAVKELNRLLTEETAGGEKS